MGQGVGRETIRWERWLVGALLVSTIALWILHYVHLSADFPHGQVWVDPARATDEGWYAGAAIRHYLSGGWHLPGDFNPAVALPVFPVAAWAVFHFTGVSAVALRAMNVTFSGASLVVMWLLMRRYGSSLSAAGAVFLVACSPFFYAYTRLGILEPLLTLEVLTAMLLASSIEGGKTRWKTTLIAVTIGVLMAMIALTKTTGICAYPAIFLLMASRSGDDLRRNARSLVKATAVTGALLCLYLVIVNRSGLMIDFKNLFAVNHARIHASLLFPTIWQVMTAGAATSMTLYVLVAVVLIPTLLLYRSTLSPLLLAATTAAVGFAVFITYHGWVMPRYYLPCLPMLAMAVMLALERLAISKRSWVRIYSGVCAAAVAVACLRQIGIVTGWTLHPNYSYLEASKALYRTINADPDGNRVVASLYGEEIALLTSEPGVYVNLVFNTADPERHVIAQRPGWLIVFDEVGPYEKPKIENAYSMQLVQSVPAYGDDESHNNLMLYKLSPIGE
jgi:4-amino-4-deoxy-L-arabinose transferase-like glycosyltransferase